MRAGGCLTEPPPSSHVPGAEVIGFAVPQFVSGKAHRALQRVAANRPMAHQLRLREAHLLQASVQTVCGLSPLRRRYVHGRWTTQRFHACGPQGLLRVCSPVGSLGRKLMLRPPAGFCGPMQPLAGVLVSLWRAEQDWRAREAGQQQGEQQQQQRAPEERPVRRQSLLAALGRQAALTGDVLTDLLDAEVRFYGASTPHAALHVWPPTRCPTQRTFTTPQGPACCRCMAACACAWRAAEPLRLPPPRARASVP